MLEVPAGEDAIRSEDLEIRPADLLALARGKPIALTGRELQLLTELARRAGRIVRREELYAAVWDQPFRESDRSVDVYVAKVRAKLERELPEWRYIHTHFGFGYRFQPEPSHLFHTPSTDR